LALEVDPTTFAKRLIFFYEPELHRLLYDLEPERHTPDKESASSRASSV
jgi:hypothetical protein